MSKYVLVDAISVFRMRYCVEIPDDLDQQYHVITPEEYAKDSVTCGDVKEFSQEHMDELIVSTRPISKEEAIKQFREDNDYLEGWDDDTIVSVGFTEIGYKNE